MQQFSLSDLGLKQTQSRNAILKFLSKHKVPADASEIEEYLNVSNIHTNQATVYRILNTFFEKGIIERFEFKEGKYRYELKSTDHHHAVCLKCGKIQDISGCNLSKLEDEVKDKTGFSVARHSLEFFGVCKTCLKLKK